MTGIDLTFAIEQLKAAAPYAADKIIYFDSQLSK